VNIPGSAITTSIECGSWLINHSVVLQSTISSVETFSYFCTPIWLHLVPQNDWCRSSFRIYREWDCCDSVQVIPCTL